MLILVPPTRTVAVSAAVVLENRLEEVGKATPRMSVKKKSEVVENVDSKQAAWLERLEKEDALYRKWLEKRKAAESKKGAS